MFLQTRGFPCDCVFPEHCDSQGIKLPPTRMQQLELEARCAAGNSNGVHAHYEPVPAAALGDAAAPDSDDRPLASTDPEAAGVAIAICRMPCGHAACVHPMSCQDLSDIARLVYGDRAQLCCRTEGCAL